MSEDGTLEIVDPRELLGSYFLATNDLLILDLLTGTVFLASLDFHEYTNVTTGLDALLSIGTGFLRGTIAVVVILVKGHTFPTNVKVRPVDEMALVSTTLFFLFKLGYDPLALESKFTPVEESTGVLETTFVEVVVLTGVFPDEGICSVNLIYLLLFVGVTASSLVPKSLMQGQKQTTLAISTTEAEYVSAKKASQQAL
nr:hypothetical protein [Tanacetum cinerariifolium]